jgi:hypothetical protein
MGAAAPRSPQRLSERLEGLLAAAEEHLSDARRTPEGAEESLALAADCAVRAAMVAGALRVLADANPYRP